MYVIVTDDRVYGSFPNENDAIEYAKAHFPPNSWFVRPVGMCEGF